MSCARRVYAFFTLFSLVLALSLPACGQVNVLMRHNDHGQTGANNAETKLTPANVRTRFQKLFTVPVVGDMYAQVLVVSNLNISGGVHNVGFAATGHDMVYAFDADRGTQYWVRPLGTPVPESIERTHDIPNEVGIVGTPVIDAGMGRMYVVAKTLGVAQPSRRPAQFLTLYALDITTGLDAVRPVSIFALYPGTGDASVVINGVSQVRFDPNKENQRPGLTLANGNVYIAFASHGDQTPYHGWVLAYDAVTLQLNGAFNTTPNSGGAGIWMSGQAPVIDNNGSLYALTGNLIRASDPINESLPATFGESYLRLKGTDLTLEGFFKPGNAEDLDRGDSDVSSGGAMEIPGTGYIIGGGKEGTLFLVAETPVTDPNTGQPLLQVKQSFDATPEHPDPGNPLFGKQIFSSPVWFNNRIYFWGNSTFLKAWTWNGIQFDTTPIPPPAGAPMTPGGYSSNAELAISSNAGTPGTGIVWALAPSEDPDGQTSGGLGTLYAFNADTLELLYSSGANASRDALGNYAKYDVPTVANGKVYVPTRSNQIVVYGLRKIFKIVPLSTPAIINQPYSFSANSTDPDAETPVNFDFSGDLPSGMSFFSATGLLTGTPGSYPGIFDFTVTANYPDGSKLPQEYALSVCQPDPPSPNLSVNIPLTSSYVIGTLKSNFSGIYSFDLVSGSLPPGMVLDRNTGMVSGAPTATGSYSPRIRTTRLPSSGVSFASCSAGTTSDVFYQIGVYCTGTQCQPQYEGYNDGLDPDNIWGWAWNKSQPSSAVQVDIYESSADVVPEGTPLLGRTTANLFRQDLLDAGKGDGNHAFIFPVPDALKDGNAHRIHVTFAGTKTDLAWSPRVLPPGTGRFVGVHSANACDRIDGFAVDNWQTSVPIDVDIFDNGQLLASLVANYDSSIVPATGGYGTHGFLYFTPDRLKDGNVHQITVTFKLSGGQLTNSNRTLSCPATTPPTLSPIWEGFFDNVTCDRVDGWGWDTNRPNSPIDIAIFADGIRVATLTANYFSQDLVNAGKGNGAHRYLYYLPDFLKDGGLHHVTAQIIGQNTDLPISSSITSGNVSCAALPVPIAPPRRRIVNTNAGPSSTASSGPATGTTPGVDVTFNSVSVAGVTSFVPVDPSTLPQLPDGYAYPHAGINPVAFDISTTAAYSGPVSVTFTILSETDFTEFSLLRILHLEGGVWQDRTVSAGFSTHTVSAQVNSLSPFVIARLIQSPALTSVSLVATGNSVYGQSVAFIARITGSGSSATPTGTVTFTDGGSFLGSAQLDAFAQATLNSSLLSAGTHQISASYSGDSLFPQGSGSFVQVVSPSPLQVSANTALRQYGIADPVLSGTVVGLRNNDNITATFQSSSTAASLAGTTYPITATLSDPNGRLGNYSVTQVPGTLTVVPAPLVITANNKSRGYGDVNPALDGVVAGLANNDGITASFSSVAGPASPVGAYAIIVAAVNDPNSKLSNYNVSTVNGSLSVIPAVLTAKANDKTRVYAAANPSFDGSVTGLRNSDVIQAQFSTSAVAGSSVGAYPIVPTLSDPGGILGNYFVVIQNGILSVTPAPLSISINPATRLYGDPNPVFTGTISGLLNNDNITAAYQSSANASSAVGTYSITATLSDPGGKLGNYSVSQSGTLTVQAVPLQVTANNKTRMYGDSNPVFDGTISGLRNSDNIQAQYSTTATAQSLVGNYPIVPSLSDPTGKSGNYTVTLQNGTLSVTRSNIQLALPNFNPSSGTYYAGQPVTISEVTSNAAAIHYTTDGSTPTASSPVYAGPLILNGTATIKALATQPEYIDSGVGLANYFVLIPVSATPASRAVLGCGSASYTVSVPAVNGFTGSLGLSVSGLPAGATASFSPASISSPGSSTLSVTTTTSTPAGNYPITITASGPTLTGSTTVTLVVQDFALSEPFSSQTVVAGGSTNNSVSASALNGFAGSVGLSVSGLPSGASATFNPTAIAPGASSALNITTSSSTAVGTYTLTVTGSSGCRTHSLNLTLIVNAPPPSGPAINSLSPNAGPVGTLVTINGANFGASKGSSTVTFNGATAQPSAWSANSISVPVPRGATSGNAVVTVGGQASNGVTFTVQDDALHIFATNCSACGWLTTDFTIQSSPLYGYTIRSGDILYFYQWQSSGSVAGMTLCFPGGDVAVCDDDGLTVDQDGKPIHADTVQGVTHFRRVDLTPSAGLMLNQITFHSHGPTKAGRWDVYFSNIQIVSTDGTVRSIFTTGSTPGLFLSSSFGVKQQGSAIEHGHVW
jgi:hypothetical protein